MELVTGIESMKKAHKSYNREFYRIKKDIDEIGIYRIDIYLDIFGTDTNKDSYKFSINRFIKNLGNISYKLDENISPFFKDEILSLKEYISDLDKRISTIQHISKRDTTGTKKLMILTRNYIQSLEDNVDEFITNSRNFPEWIAEQKSHQNN